jgi:hypothetical protein
VFNQAVSISGIENKNLDVSATNKKWNWKLKVGMAIIKGFAIFNYRVLKNIIMGEPHEWQKGH